MYLEIIRPVKSFSCVMWKKNPFLRRLIIYCYFDFIIMIAIFNTAKSFFLLFYFIYSLNIYF